MYNMYSIIHITSISQFIPNITVFIFAALCACLYDMRVFNAYTYHLSRLFHELCIPDKWLYVVMYVPLHIALRVRYVY